MTTPELLTIDVADAPDGWAAAGFTIGEAADGTPVVDIGAIRIRLQQPVSTTSWSFADVENLDDIDGVPVTTASSAERGEEGPESDHPNGSFHLDHVVMISPDLRRTVPTLEANGFEVRRRRDIGKGREQVFLWTGPTIIELVGPTAPTEPKVIPSDLWGLAVSTNDIDGAAKTLGENLGRVKDAVQPGRRIATVRTTDLAITPTIALMTPHG